mgnify:CR=1 FL=1
MTPPCGTSVTLRRGWRHWGGVFLVITTLLLASGCATKGDLKRLQDEIAAQSNRENAQLRGLSVDIQDLEDSLGVQSALASELVVDTRGGIALELRDIQTQLSQLTALTGQIHRSLLLLSERVLADGPRVTTSGRGAGPDSLPTLVEGGGTPEAAEEMYAAAMTQYNRGQLETARMAFRRFLGDFPGDPQAARAQFLLADALEQDNQIDLAIDGFLRVSELYPGSNQVPGALYRIALIYVDQDNADEAAVFLERLTNTYPDTPQAEVAQELLQDIR